MEYELPRFDLPEDFLTGVLNDSMILSLYTQYPCRIKAEMYVLVKRGKVKASINMIDFDFVDNTFIVILPGSILQINKIEGDIEIYFAGFSSDFLRTINPTKSIFDVKQAIQQNPIVPLKGELTTLVEKYYLLADETIRMFKTGSREALRPLYHAMIFALNGLYLKEKVNKENLTPTERISQDFKQLVLENYTKEKNVAFYAEKLGITAAYLSTIVKQTTGKTCTDIISDMVIMDAKAQLKSTNLSVFQIADSLNFNNVSFFGKYFKRHVGVSPLEYRNSTPDD